MDFGDITRAIVRRKFIVIPLLLLTIVASLASVELIKPKYVMTSYVQLVPSTATGDTDVNPWNNLGVGSLSLAAMYSTEDQTFLSSLPAQGASSDILIDVGYPNPVITFTVTAASPEQAKKTMDLIVNRYTDQTQSLQKQSLQNQLNVSSAYLITSQRLDQGQNLATANGTRYKTAILLFAFGLMVTFGLTIGIDARLRRKVSRVTDAARIAATPGTSVRGQVSNSGRPGSLKTNGDTPTAIAPRVATVDSASERAAASDATVVMSLPKWSASDDESGDPS